MKNITISIFIGLVAIFSSCNPIEDRFELGKKLTPDQIEATVVPLNGTNKLVLKNNTPSIGGTWDYKFGLSTKMTDTVVVPVVGTYSITYIATTDGGIVNKDISVTITEMSYHVPGYSELTGNGEGKTWVYDKDDEDHDYCYMTDPNNWQGKWWDPATGSPFPDANASIRFEIDGAKTVFKFIPESGSEVVGSFSLDMANMKLKVVDSHILDYKHAYADPDVTATGIYEIKVLNDNSLVLFQKFTTGYGWVWKFNK